MKKTTIFYFNTELEIKQGIHLKIIKIQEKDLLTEPSHHKNFTSLLCLYVWPRICRNFYSLILYLQRDCSHLSDIVWNSGLQVSSPTISYMVLNGHISLQLTSHWPGLLNLGTVDISADNFSLCILGCLAVSLASTH